MQITVTKYEAVELCDGDLDRALELLGIDHSKWSEVPSDMKFGMEVKVEKDPENGRLYISV